MPGRLIAGVEAGGTKVLCAVAREDGTVLDRARIVTVAPDRTFADVESFFVAAADRLGPVVAAGVASFGPLDLDRDSANYGRLTITPKPGWSEADMLGRIAAIVNAPVGIDTDVNCAALAEMRHGTAQGLNRVCYVTVGTGIGVGIVENGRTNAGAGHPEVGHIRVPHAPGDTFVGTCPSHGDCLEGLACGPAMGERWSIAAEDLPDDHLGWQHAAHYLAALCVNLTYIVRPQRIVIGGGVAERPALLPAVRDAFRAMAADYAPDRFSSDADTFIVPPLLRDPSPGLVGALDMAAALAGSGSR